MATGLITKRSVDALQPDTREAFLWDGELRGFGVKVTPAGAKTYVYSYRMGGREAPKRRYTIGKHGSPWTPESARNEAKRLALLVGQGTDPVAADKERRRQSVSLAFGSYAAKFTDEYLKENWPGGWSIADGILRRDAAPAFAGLALPQITRAHVSTFLDTLSDRPAVRRNAFAALRRLFRWAVSRGDLALSPIAEMEAPPAPAARDRVLSNDELSLIWQASDGLSFPFGPMVRLLIVTGQRREEVAGLTWAELDRAAAMWTLPAQRAKNDQAHLVPLSPLAIEVLDHVAQLAGAGAGAAWPRRGFVFTTNGATSASGYSRAKRRLDDAITRLVAETNGVEPVGPWRFHDLRRTTATGLQRLGVRFEVTEAVLNHLSGAKSGVAGVYQRHDWKDEKRAALAAWSDHLFVIVRAAANTNARS